MNKKARFVMFFYVLFAIGSSASSAMDKSIPKTDEVLPGYTSFYYQAKANSAYLAADTDSYLLAQNDLGLTADAPEEKAASGEYTDEEIAEMINNPLGSLWLLFSQNDTMWMGGDALDALNEDDKIYNTFLLNPVMPMQLTDDIKWIFRPVVPIVSFDIPSINPGPSVDFDRETGLGDIVLLNAFSTNEGVKPPNIFGAGFTLMMDTASDDSLGTGKWSAGPAMVAFRITDKWIIGGVFQHFWSFAGDSDRSNVNLTDFQYILRYRLSPETNIGMGPNIRYDWNKDSSDSLTLPIGIGADTLIKLGPLPVKIGFEVYYYAVTPDSFGPEWQLRLFFTPVLPSPSWSKNPLF